jgi:P27 family predicted phage terminase small subunit
MRGRKPAPPELKVLRGDQPCRQPVNPPPASGRPEPPPYLGRHARDEWDRLTAELEEAGVLARTDRGAIEVYCVTYAHWLQARALINEKGMLVATADGVPKANPAVGIAGACARLLFQYQSEFGGTPAARGRVRSGTEPPPDELQAYLMSRKA